MNLDCDHPQTFDTTLVDAAFHHRASQLAHHELIASNFTVFVLDSSIVKQSMVKNRSLYG